jgi:hypothetical protein
VERASSQRRLLSSRRVFESSSKTTPALKEAADSWLNAPASGALFGWYVQAFELCLVRVRDEAEHQSPMLGAGQSRFSDLISRIVTTTQRRKPIADKTTTVKDWATPVNSF